MAIRQLQDLDPAVLAELIGIETRVPRMWNAGELAAVLQHQLSVPVRFDLRQLSTGAAGQLAVVADAEELLLKNFNDLLHHPNPPVKLLAMMKDFAKANLSHPNSPFPREITSVLYYAAIVAALVNRRARITKLDNASLLEGINSALAEPWLDMGTRALLQRGADELHGKV